MIRLAQSGNCLSRFCHDENGVIVMMLELAPGWNIQLDRGPDWLFVRLIGEAPFDSDGIDFSDRVWVLLQQQFSHRLIIEMDQVDWLRSHLIGELVRLHKRIYTAGGVMRLCGLSDNNQEVLRSSRLAERFPQYANREEAVMGYRPSKPR